MLQSTHLYIIFLTGVVKSTQRIDYEKIKYINFTLIAYDNGVPQLSTTAGVTVEIMNANDEEPKFATEAYDAAVDENAPGGTRVVTVTAVDKDEGKQKNTSGFGVGIEPAIFCVADGLRHRGRQLQKFQLSSFFEPVVTLLILSAFFLLLQ